VKRTHVCLLIGISLLVLGGTWQGLTQGTASAHAVRENTTHHYLYVFPPGSLAVYDIDHGFRLVKSISLPQTEAGVRGAGVYAVGHALFLSYGGSGGAAGTGSLLRYDLLANRVRWVRRFPFGVDSLAITPSGTKIYLPTGESSSGDAWEIISPESGRVIGAIHAHECPHDTVVSLNGRHVYLAARGNRYLLEASTQSDRVIKKIGPLLHGIRPFTITGGETFAFTTEEDFLGFQVCDIGSGKVLYTLAVRGFPFTPTGSSGSTPSHGIALSPDEKWIWLIDRPHDYVHLFDVSQLPRSRPKQVADIHLTGQMAGKQAWLGMSRDGRFLFVAGAGDAVDTRTRRTVATLPALTRAKVYLEIDFRGGAPIFATPREAIGYVTR